MMSTCDLEFLAETLAAVPRADVDLMASRADVVVLAARELLPSDVPVIVFVLAGIVRELYDGKAGVTRVFAKPGDLAANAFDGADARVRIAAVTAARVAVLPWVWVEQLAHERSAVARLLQEQVALAHAELLEREFQYATKSAREHYLHLRSTKPWIEAHAPLYEVASYLRITPVHLSRLRRALARSASPDRGSAGSVVRHDHVETAPAPDGAIGPAGADAGTSRAHARERIGRRR